MLSVVMLNVANEPFRLDVVILSVVTPFTSLLGTTNTHNDIEYNGTRQNDTLHFS
jgi:hypothetical protein